MKAVKRLRRKSKFTTPREKGDMASHFGFTAVIVPKRNSHFRIFRKIYLFSSESAKNCVILISEEQISSDY